MEKKIPDPERQLAYLAYVNRENDFQHHAYDEEMKQYRLMQSGDPAAVEESQQMMRRNLAVGLSSDPVQNAKFSLPGQYHNHHTLCHRGRLGC